MKDCNSHQEVIAINAQPERRSGPWAALSLVGALLVAVVTLLAPTTAQAQNMTIPTAYVASSGNPALDQHVTNLIKEQLDGEINLQPLLENQTPLTPGTPVITLGPAAFSRVLQLDANVPVLAMLIEKRAVQNYISRAPGRIGAVYYDVPLLRQALTGKAILPQATKISILATIGMSELYEPLIDQLADYGLRARVFIVSDEGQLIPSLNRALSYGDFLLAGADDRIYNPRNIKHILLTAYRRNRILIGPSQAYVKAGALASSYAPFTTMAEQASDYLLQFFATGEFPEPDYPVEYRVEVNQQVARSLNIPLPDREWITNTVDQFIRDQREKLQ